MLNTLGKTQLDDSIVDFEVRPPLESWAAGALLIPREAKPRVDRLLRYQDWYEGFFRPYMPRATDRIVKNNLFRRIAVFLADFLKSRAPEIDHAGDPPVSARFVESMQESLYNVMLDYARYGVGLFQLQLKEYGWEVDSPQPIYWFPIDDMTQVLLQMSSMAGESFVDVTFDFGVGGTVEERYSLDNDRLGDLVDDPTPLEFGTELDWEMLAASSYGRLGTIVSTARRPTTGDWGLSAFADVFSLIFESNRSLSQTSRILTYFGNPKLKFKRSNTSTQPMVQQRINLNPGNQSTAARKVEITRFHDRDLDQDSTIIEPPAGYDDVEFLTFTGSLRDHQMQSQLIDEHIFMQSSIPAALWGIQSGSPPAGVALSRQYVPTSVYIQDAQESLIKAIRKVLLIGALAAGTSTAELARYADNMLITWPNIFDDSVLHMQGMRVWREDSDGSEEMLSEPEDIIGDEDEFEPDSEEIAEDGQIEVLP